MTWATDLTWCRRYLRDPDGNIWSEALLRDLYNETQHEVQRRTKILEDWAIVSVPPRFQYAYQHEWEHGLIDGTQPYRCLRNQQNVYAFTSLAEVQEFAGGEANISDTGATVTQPWEGWVLDTGRNPSLPFPSNHHATLAMYYDEEPIDVTTRKDVQLNDPSWETRQGKPIAYYIDSELDGWFVPYPRPTDTNWQDHTGTGVVTSVDGDTTGSEVGTITQRTTSVVSGDTGVAVDVLDTDDNMAMFYQVEPTELSSLGSISDFPDYLARYVRFGVLQRAYNANTDGRIPSLAAYWGRRFEAGIQALKRYKSRRKEDRTYTLRGQHLPSRHVRRLSRLPDGYPAL